MKITLLKNHLNHTAGDTIEVTDQRGGYLVRVKVASTEVSKKGNKEFKEPFRKAGRKTKK